MLLGPQGRVVHHSFPRLKAASNWNETGHDDVSLPISVCVLIAVQNPHFLQSPVGRVTLRAQLQVAVSQLARRTAYQSVRFSPLLSYPLPFFPFPFIFLPSPRPHHPISPSRSSLVWFVSPSLTYLSFLRSLYRRSPSLSVLYCSLSLPPLVVCVFPLSSILSVF